MDGLRLRPVPRPQKNVSPRPQRMLDEQEIWQERPTGGSVDASLLARPWREVLRLIHDGGAPQPPIAHLSGRRLIDLGEGHAELAMPATDWFLGPKGRLDSGVFTFLADMTHFYAVLSTLPAGAGCATAERSMTFLGADSSSTRCRRTGGSSRRSGPYSAA